MATAYDPARLATHPAQLTQALELQRRSFDADPNPARAIRRDRLDRLRRMLREHADGIRDAIAADFGMRASQETLLLEQFTSLEGIAHSRRHLRSWMRTERRHVAWWSLPGRARLMRQPLGVIGIIVPWNYPLFLAVSPLTCALAAGNRAMLKMSEHTPRFGALFESLIARSFSADEVLAVNGDTGVAKAFAVRPPAVHGLDAGRPRGDEGRERQPDAGDAGTRRQVAGHRRRRLRPDGDGTPAHVRQADERGADLRRSGLCAGAGGDGGRIHRGLPRGGDQFLSDARDQSPVHVDHQ
jgi:hypothetical protein